MKEVNKPTSLPDSIIRLILEPSLYTTCTHCNKVVPGETIRGTICRECQYEFYYQ